MVNFIYRNRHGYITVMLTLILTAVLALSSTLMEAARYKNMKQIYNELEESAEFSALASYDRDLYSNFGLLAIDSEFDQEQFRNYLQTNLNGALSNKNSVDSMLKLTDSLEFDKLYDLSQNEVLRAQIEEFCSYRAPYYLVDNTLNIEETLKSFASDLEKQLPILNMFKNLCSCAEKIFNTYTKLIEFSDSSKEMDTAISEYESAVDVYNAAVSERDTLIASHEQTDSDSDEGNNSNADGNYDQQLQQKNQVVVQKASELMGKIRTLKEKIGTHAEKYQEFVNAFDAMLGANVKAILSAAKADANKIEDKKEKENCINMITDMETGYDSSESVLKNLTKYWDKSYLASLNSQQDKLQEQYRYLADTQAENLNSTSKHNIKTSSFMIVLSLLVEVIATLESLVTEWTKMCNVIKDCITLLKMVQTTGNDGIMSDIKYNNTIAGETWGNLPSRSSGTGNLKQIENPYEKEDSENVKSMIDVANSVADKVNFDTSLMKSSYSQNENFALQNALENTQRAEKELLEAFQSLGSAFGLIKKIMEIWNVCVRMFNYLGCLVTLVSTMIATLHTEIAKIVYQRTLPSIYANTMFSNRTTEGGTRLNGSSYFDFSDPGLGVSDKYFDSANAEYVVVGSPSERLNQEIVFSYMMSVRMICNIPAILTNQGLMNIVTGLCSTIIGIIVAIILVIVMMVFEAYLDMLFMLYGDGSVSFIKIEGYLQFGGNMEALKEEIEGLSSMIKDIKTQAERNEKDKEKGKSKADAGNKNKEYFDKKAEDYVKGLTEWNYTDHLLLLTILFVPNDTIYARCADLIQMQMQEFKRRKGSTVPFQLNKMTTTVRVDSTVEYTPILPIPTIPGANSTGIKIHRIHYSSY